MSVIVASGALRPLWITRLHIANLEILSETGETEARWHRHNGVSTSPQSDAYDGRVKELSLVLEQRRFLCTGESTAAKPLILILLTSTHTHLNEVVSRITCAEWSFEEQVESIMFLFGFNQLIVLLAVQRDVALTVTPGILKESHTIC